MLDVEFAVAEDLAEQRLELRFAGFKRLGCVGCQGAVVDQEFELLAPSLTIVKPSRSTEA